MGNAWHLLAPFLLVACAAPGVADPFATADATLAWEEAPPPTIAFTSPAALRIGATNTLTVSGALVQGERVYIGASLAGQGNGPCLAAAGGLCLGIRNPIVLLGTATAGANGAASLSVTVPTTIANGTPISLQAVVIRGLRGADSTATDPVTLTASTGPAEGSALSTWTEFDFADDGYRDGCAGGTKYIKSTPYADPAYVGVTLCSDTTYKIWLSDTIYGTFTSAGDWSGSGEDHCDYVGGDYVDAPQGSNAVDPGQACWSRGPAGVAPVYEASCINNRWIAPAHTCSVRIPGAAGPAEGTTLSSWTEVNFVDDGYRDGCAGGRKYVKSTPYGDPGYVGVTLCDDTHYKIWLSTRLYGLYTSAGDWSGSGEDQCEYVGGDFITMPQGSTAVDPGQPCWGRGALGTTPLFEDTCASNRWVAPVHHCAERIPRWSGPRPGTTLTQWTAFNFIDDGYRDGCAGGDKYVLSTGYASAPYVGVTTCGRGGSYKIWLSDDLYGLFVSPGDWSGSGEDHCEYVGGTFDSFPQGSTGVGANQACWSRGAAGVAPVYEETCVNNRWIAPEYDCNVVIP